MAKVQKLSDVHVLRYEGDVAHLGTLLNSYTVKLHVLVNVNVIGIIIIVTVTVTFTVTVTVICDAYMTAA